MLVLPDDSNPIALGVNGYDPQSAAASTEVYCVCKRPSYGFSHSKEVDRERNQDKQKDRERKKEKKERREKNGKRRRERERESVCV